MKYAKEQDTDSLIIYLEGPRELYFSLAPNGLLEQASKMLVDKHELGLLMPPAGSDRPVTLYISKKNCRVVCLAEATNTVEAEIKRLTAEHILTCSPV